MSDRHMGLRVEAGFIHTQVRESSIWNFFSCLMHHFLWGFSSLSRDYFVSGSFDRHGSRKFIIDKLIRFGIPLIFAFLIMIPMLEYVKYLKYVNHITFKDFYFQQWFGYVPNEAGHHGSFNFAHLWFIEHLLIYSILYAIIRTVLKRYVLPIGTSTARRARLYAIISYILILGVITNLMRTTWNFPMDRWIGFSGSYRWNRPHTSVSLTFHFRHFCI